MTDSLPFAVADLSIEALADDPLTLPSFAGSVLRGAFGAALRRLACLTGAPSCLGCQLRKTCPYPSLFEPPPVDLSEAGIGRTVENGTPPFVLRPPEGPLKIAAGERWTVQMRVFGHALDRMPFLIEAWRDALTRGLGRDRARSTLVRVACRPASVAQSSTDPLLGVSDHEDPRPEDWGFGDAWRSVARLNGSAFRIDFITPLRLVSAGKALRPPDCTARRIVAATVRRGRTLAVQAGGPAACADVKAWPVDQWLEAAERIEAKNDLRWRDWKRYSARQKREMILGGVIGSAEWRNVDGCLGKILNLAVLTHVGKETAFGFGRMSIEALD